MAWIGTNIYALYGKTKTNNRVAYNIRSYCLYSTRSTYQHKDTKTEYLIIFVPFKGPPRSIVLCVSVLKPEFWQVGTSNYILPRALSSILSNQRSKKSRRKLDLSRRNPESSVSVPVAWMLFHKFSGESLSWCVYYF